MALGQTAVLWFGTSRAEIYSSILTEAPSVPRQNSCYATNLASAMTSRKSNYGTMTAAMIYRAEIPDIVKVEQRQIPKPASG